MPQDLKDELTAKLNSIKNYQTRKRTIDNLANDGIDVTDNRKYIRDAERQCVNSVIQGSAADITKIAMIELGTNEELKKLGYKMLFPVHDILCS